MKLEFVVLMMTEHQNNVNTQGDGVILHQVVTVVRVHESFVDLRLPYVINHRQTKVSVVHRLNSLYSYSDPCRTIR